jgi:hypothetical protein
VVNEIKGLSFATNQSLDEFSFAYLKIQCGNHLDTILSSPDTLAASKYLLSSESAINCLITRIICGNTMSSKKSLSGSTMGMRFMQRLTPSKAKPLSEDETNQNSQNLDEKTPQHNPSTNDIENNASIPIMASSSDMYGVSAEIIGRRSFNNFHKSVEETWTSAIKSRSQSKFDDKVEKQQITDEELLERYGKYVNGKGDMLNKKERSIGNLSKKKRKR